MHLIAIIVVKTRFNNNKIISNKEIKTVSNKEILAIPSKKIV